MAAVSASLEFAVYGAAVQTLRTEGFLVRLRHISNEPLERIPPRVSRDNPKAQLRKEFAYGGEAQDLGVKHDGKIFSLGLKAFDPLEVRKRKTQPLRILGRDRPLEVANSFL
jgi:hypothetical protein